jgi:hypothetical protein
MTYDRKVRRIRKDPNFLPEHICLSFEAALDSLIEGFRSYQNPKYRYLHAEYKSKYVSKETASAEMRRTAAKQKWLAAEERNRTTNQRLLLESQERDFGWVTSERFLGFARKIIRDVLGEIEDFSLDLGTFSNGASTRVRRSPKAAILKHSGQAHVSSSAVKHWVLDSAKGSVLQDLELKIHESSTFFTVPKSTDIDRVACKEPEINMFMQREVGTFIRNRLKRRGIDLRDQTRNQELARRAYTSNLATIDLSSASDSITIRLVFELLPYEWFSLLDDLRVKHSEIDGELHELHMFSSMGNGFTFELESLIFYALTCAVGWASGVKGEVSVYGDDIICSSKIAPRLARIFHWLGFMVNPKKSNWTGPVRESCGKHFHKTQEVTPFYLRKPISCKTDVIRVLNQLYKWSSEGTGIILDPAVLVFHQKWCQIIPDKYTGGDDLESDQSLVTGGLYKGRLLRVSEPLNYDDEVALVWWLTTKRQAPFEVLECDPAKVTRFTSDPYSEFRFIRTWDKDKGRSCSKKVHKTGWQRPKFHGSPYLLACELLRPNIRGSGL